VTVTFSNGRAWRAPPGAPQWVRGVGHVICMWLTMMGATVREQHRGHVMVESRGPGMLSIGACETRRGRGGGGGGVFLRSKTRRRVLTNEAGEGGRERGREGKRERGREGGSLRAHDSGVGCNLDRPRGEWSPQSRVTQSHSIFNSNKKYTP